MTSLSRKRFVVFGALVIAIGSAAKEWGWQSASMVALVFVLGRAWGAFQNASREP